MTGKHKAQNALLGGILMQLIISAHFIAHCRDHDKSEVPSRLSQSYTLLSQADEYPRVLQNISVIQKH